MHAGPPTPASPGYAIGQVSHSNLQGEIQQVRGAMNDKSGKKLMKVLADFDPVTLSSLAEKYKAQIFSDLAKDIASLTKGDAENFLLLLIKGPLEHDVWYLNKGIANSKEELINDILLGRSNADINAIKAAYQKTHRTPLETAIKNAPVNETFKRLYAIALSAQRYEDSMPANPQQGAADAKELQEATEGVRFGANELAVFRVLVTRNDAQLREAASAFQKHYHKSLEAVLKSDFKGQTEDAVLLLLSRALNRPNSDAKMLEESMKGFGTDETLLESRCLRIHWDRSHLAKVKDAYKALYGKDLIKKVKSETSRTREDFLVALLD